MRKTLDGLPQGVKPSVRSGKADITAGHSAYLQIRVYVRGSGAHPRGTRIPLGLYWTSSARAEKGAYVIVCPPKASVFDEATERGYIAAGFCSRDA